MDWLLVNAVRRVQQALTKKVFSLYARSATLPVLLAVGPSQATALVAVHLPSSTLDPAF